MQTVHAPLFSGITDEQQQRMLVCFGVREESFLPEDLIYDFNDRRNIIGLIISGTARVERVDERGVRTILEHLERESVFGEMLMFDNIAGDSLTVVCEKDCRVWFIPRRPPRPPLRKCLRAPQPDDPEHVPPCR